MTGKLHVLRYLKKSLHRYAVFERKRSVASIHRLLIINPGSTSTKLAIFDDETLVYKEDLRHGAEELAKFAHIYDQYAYRKEMILQWLGSVGLTPESLTAVVGRGGLLRPIPGGTYRVGDRMLADLKAGHQGEHASNLGAALAWEIAQAAGGNRRSSSIRWSSMNWSPLPGFPACPPCRGARFSMP